MTTAYTYILQCANGQYYVGSTTDLDKRLQEHQAGLGTKFTRAHLPVKLVYKEEYSSIEMAFSRERQLHGWSRAKKEALIKGQNDALRSLSLSKGRTSIASTGASTGASTSSATGSVTVSAAVSSIDD